MVLNNPWWPAILALAIVSLDFVFREEADTPIKALMITARSLRETILNSGPVSRLLKSLIVHMYKPGNILVNFMDWVYETWEDIPKYPLIYLQTGWDLFVNIVTNMDFNFVMPLLIEEIAEDTQIPEEDIYKFLKKMDSKFEANMGYNVTVASQMAIENVVNVSKTSLDELREHLDWLSKTVKETYESEDWILYEYLKQINPNEIMEKATSKGTLDGISRSFRSIRKYFSFSSRKAELPNETKFLKLDRSKDFMDNLVIAVTNSVWYIVEWISLGLRGGDETRCRSWYIDNKIKEDSTLKDEL